MPHVLGRAGRALLAFLFPDACLACGAPLGGGGERDLCPGCRASIDPRLRTAALPSWPQETGPAARPFSSVAFFALPFDGPARALVHALKYGGRPRAADTLAAAVGPVAARVAAGRVDAVVPVPLHPVRLRERGFNQAELIARAIAPLAGAPVRPACLARESPTRTQTDLAAGERLANVRGAFAARGAAPGRTVLLVDDVVTTGATLAAAAEALAEAGTSAVCFAAAGTKPVDRRTPRRLDSLD